MQNRALDSTRTQQMAAWFAMGMACLALILAAAAYAIGGRFHWNAWVLPLIIGTNVGVFNFAWLRRWPRIARWYPYASLSVALVVLVASIIETASRQGR